MRASTGEFRSRSWPMAHTSVGEIVATSVRLALVPRAAVETAVQEKPFHRMTT
jgi:hypothetical protein